MARRLQQAQAGMHSYIGAMLQGQEDERKRLARELHDDTLQALIALDQRRQMLQRALARDPAKAPNHLEQIQIMLDGAIKNLRGLIRDMRPSYIEDLGLPTALEALVMQNAGVGKADITFTTGGGVRRLAANHELGLYRIAQEALTNALRHAGATQIRLALDFDGDVSLSIQDNGQGFVIPDRPGILAQAGHYGLMGMVERAEQMSARFRIDSTPGKGTLIEVRLTVSGA
jgi:signal transduction histidine kinase